MTKIQKWFALVLLAAFFASAIAPAAALAGRGDRFTDLPDDQPVFPEYEYGDPDPDPGRPLQWNDLAMWKEILRASMRIRVVLANQPAVAAGSRTHVTNNRLHRGTSK